MPLRLARLTIFTVGIAARAMGRRSGREERDALLKRRIEERADPYRVSLYRPPRGAMVAALVIAILGAASYAVDGLANLRQREQRAARLTGGDPHRGEASLLRYGCAGCHTIPGIARADGLIGPPLDFFDGRIYVAGMLPNTPDNLIRWIVNPRGVNPQTAMPVTGISPNEARDAAAYLYTLR